MTKLSTPIIIDEVAGIDRIGEPVSVGIPFPNGLLFDTSELRLSDHEQGFTELQSQPLAKWIDGSLKWVLFDFQVSVPANTTRELILLQGHSPTKPTAGNCIATEQDEDYININTGAASFSLSTNLFNPFSRVVINRNNILDDAGSRLFLTDENGDGYEPRINKMFIETKGKLRTTVRAEGDFTSSKGFSFANFFARMHFYAKRALVRIDFTIHNSRAAKHPGGLWDLGDPGSLYFKDLSFNVPLNTDEGLTINWLSQTDDPLNAIDTSDLVIYQDSSGGENWQSNKPDE